MDKKYLYSKLLENVKLHFKEDLNGLQDLQFIVKDEESAMLLNDSDTIKIASFDLVLMDESEFRAGSWSGNNCYKIVILKGIEKDSINSDNSIINASFYVNFGAKLHSSYVSMKYDTLNDCVIELAKIEGNTQIFISD